MADVYSQEKMLAVFSQKFEIDGKKCVGHIKTAISNVFVFPDKVYKIYKNDNSFFNDNFNDISQKNKRFDFTIKDFDWNQRMAPEIYLTIRGCVMRDGQIVFVEKEEAEELVIEMKKIDTNSALLLQLLDKNLSLTDFETIGFQLHKRLDDLPEAYTQKKLKGVMQLRMEDVSNWVLGVPKHISPEEAKIFLEALDRKKSAYMNQVSDEEMAGSNIDGHSENMFFNQGRLYIMDSYAPKKDWLLADGHLNFYRLATDILALGNQESFEAFKGGYEKYRDLGVMNEKRESFCIFYSSMIMVPYLYMLGEHDERRMKAARIYHNFVRNLLGQ